MELILADYAGHEICTVWADFDIDIGGENTFELALDYPSWNTDYKDGALVYVPGTEYGGIIHDVQGMTETDQIFVRGYTWRGYLAHRIIEPEAGDDYKRVSGELNAVIRQIIGNTLGSLFVVESASTGVTVSNYQFNRYVSVVDGLTAMLASVGYRLDIRYVQTDTSGYVSVQALPASNYGNDIEISQDARLNFASRDYKMGVNHLICLGIGELRDRAILHLYADAYGNISTTKTISGLLEIVEVFDNPGADGDVLMTTGIERFKQLINRKEFTAAIKDVDDIDLYLGDTFTGRDYITGNVVTKPITQKIIKRENGIITVDYKIEGED